MTDQDVTVVIPTTGRGRGLTSAVESVLAQRGPRAKLVVVVDGAATDEGDRRTLEQLDSSDLVIRVSGVGNPAVVRNIGLGLSGTPWVAFLDDDDSWEQDKLSQQLDAARSAGRPTLVASNAWRVVEGRTQGMYLQDLPPKVSLPDMLKTNWVITSSVLADAEALRVVGGFPTAPSFRAIEDYCAWLKLAAVGSVVILRDPLIRYTVGAAGSLSASDPLSGHEARRRALEHLRQSSRMWASWRTLRARRLVGGAL